MGIIMYYVLFNSELSSNQNFTQFITFDEDIGSTSSTSVREL